MLPSSKKTRLYETIVAQLGQLIQEGKLRPGDRLPPERELAARLQVSRIPVPFALWHALARLGEVMPGHPLTRNQVELMEIDTVVSPHARTLADLGIQPRGLERTVEMIAFPETAA